MFFKRLCCFIFAFLFAMISCTTAFAAKYSSSDIDDKINSLLNYEYKYSGTSNSQSFVSDYLAKKAGTSTGDWFIIALSRNNEKFKKNTYVKNLNTALQKIYNEGINRAKLTDLQRMSLAYTACSADIRNIDGKNLLADCTYNRDINDFSTQGLMALDYALIVLDSKSYNIPQNAKTTRDDLVAKILSLQLENGGFALSGTASDTDVTAITITALAPYVKYSNAVKTAVDNAINRLSETQCDDGGFKSYGKSNSESNAQVIVALTSLSLDPAKDSRFIKNGLSPVDALLSFQLGSGGFSHLAGGNANQMATYQALYTMVAYKNYLKNEEGLYNFSDDDNDQVIATEPVIVVPNNNQSEISATNNSPVDNGYTTNQNPTANANNNQSFVSNSPNSQTANQNNATVPTANSSTTAPTTSPTDKATISTADEYMEIDLNNSNNSSIPLQNENKPNYFLSTMLASILLLLIFVVMFLYKSVYMKKKVDTLNNETDNNNEDNNNSNEELTASNTDNAQISDNPQNSKGE